MSSLQLSVSISSFVFGVEFEIINILCKRNSESVNRSIITHTHTHISPCIELHYILNGWISSPMSDWLLKCKTKQKTDWESRRRTVYITVIHVRNSILSQQRNIVNWICVETRCRVQLTRISYNANTHTLTPSTRTHTTDRSQCYNRIHRRKHKHEQTRERLGTCIDVRVLGGGDDDDDDDTTMSLSSDEDLECSRSHMCVNCEVVQVCGQLNSYLHRARTHTHTLNGHECSLVGQVVCYTERAVCACVSSSSWSWISCTRSTWYFLMVIVLRNVFLFLFQEKSDAFP